jgi:hypothetical protein
MTEPAPPYVLLASSPYSGSTLLSYLLASHPGIASISDVSGRRREHRMASFSCSCGRLMVECDFWLKLRQAMSQRDERDLRLADFELGFDHGTHGRLARLRTGSMRWKWLEGIRDAIVRRLPGQERAFQAVGLRNRRFAAAVAEVAGGRVFIDASKERLRARYLRRYVDPNLKVIHLIRDVRGVVHSARGHASHAGSDVARLGRDWARTNDVLDRVTREAAASHVLVSYEELCAAPEQVMRRLYRFCGVGDLPPEHRPREQHMLGNRVRLATMTDVRLDERWRAELSAEEEARILAVAGRVQARLRARLDS